MYHFNRRHDNLGFENSGIGKHVNRSLPPYTKRQDPTEIQEVNP